MFYSEFRIRVKNNCQGEIVEHGFVHDTKPKPTLKNHSASEIISLLSLKYLLKF